MKNADHKVARKERKRRKNGQILYLDIQHLEKYIWITDMQLTQEKEEESFHMYQLDKEEMRPKNNGYPFSQDREILSRIFTKSLLSCILKIRSLKRCLLRLLINSKKQLINKRNVQNFNLKNVAQNLEIAQDLVLKFHILISI